MSGYQQYHQGASDPNGFVSGGAYYGQQQPAQPQHQYQHSPVYQAQSLQQPQPSISPQPQQYQHQQHSQPQWNPPQQPPQQQFQLPQQQQHQQQQQQHHDLSQQLQHHHQEQHHGGPRRTPFSVAEALPLTPFTSIFPREPTLITNPTIGSGPLAPSVADLVSHDDLDALNREAGHASHSKRLEGSLEFIQTLLRPDKVTNYQFKPLPSHASTSTSPARNVTDGLSPFTRMVFDNTSIGFHTSSPAPSKPSPANGDAMARLSKKSPKPRRPEPPKVVKHNPASTNTQAASQNKRIEVHIPSFKDLSAATGITNGSPSQPPVRAPPEPPAAVVQPSQPQTVSMADLMMQPQPAPALTPKTSASSTPAAKPVPLPDQTPVPVKTEEKAEMPQQSITPQQSAKQIEKKKAPKPKVETPVPLPKIPAQGLKSHSPQGSLPQPSVTPTQPAPAPLTPAHVAPAPVPVAPPVQAVPPPVQAVPPPVQAVPPPVQAVPPPAQAVPPSAQAIQPPAQEVPPPAQATPVPPPVLPVQPPHPQVEHKIKAETPQPSAPKPTGISIELPAVSFNKDEFAVVPDSPDAPQNLSMKRAQPLTDDPLGTDLNQRELANNALGDLQRYLQDVDEAEGHVSSNPGFSSHLVYLTSDQQPTMTAVAHTKIHSHVKKTIDLGCFSYIPAGALSRLQNLSEGALKQADSMDFKLDQEWGEADIGLWAQQLDQVETGLKAARTALRIMCGGREEKQLYSEDLITQGLSLFRNVMDGIIVPITEMRSSSSTPNAAKYLAAYKKPILALFTACQRLFSLTSELMTCIDLSESDTNKLEDASSQLIFVHTERDSLIGPQKFDGIRSVAMNVLSQVFLMNPSQRHGIFNDILSNLEKLPVGKASARQFKLSDGGSIQPISALIMRLVQACAGKVDDQKAKMSGRLLDSLETNGEEGSQGPGPGNHGMIYIVKTEDSASIQHSTAIQEIQDLAAPLMGSAMNNASYVVKFIIDRALKSSKTGETPYRNFLDLFVEDLTTCLDSPDWPASELLLRLLMHMMVQQSGSSSNNSAPARTMALELLGVMAAAISTLRVHVRKIASSFEGSDADDLGRWLADLASIVIESKVPAEKALGWLGPYRIVLEFLQDRIADDQYLKSAMSYLVTEWAYQIKAAYDADSEEAPEKDAEYGRVAYRLRNMIEDPKWLTKEYTFKSVASSHAKLSHAILALRSPFCSQFHNIINILTNSMTTEQATVKSRSLKSITQVMETDPTLLDGDSFLVGQILFCSGDSSPQVRDSAISLIGKCIHLRPHLEAKMTPTVLERFIDSGIGVRKRAMKLARDIYLGNESKDVRSAIANGLLHRMQDPDEGVRDLAKQMIEEVWIAPFYKEDNDSMSFKQHMTDHVALIVQTSKQGNTAQVLDKVFQTILSPDSRLAEANAKVCTKLVASMFDLVDSQDDSADPSVPSGKDALQVLQIFAKADPKLFSFEQIRLLKPYIVSVKSSVDITVSRAVVVIYCRVLPQLSSIHSQFLGDVRKELLPAVKQVTRNLLDDVVACVWIISTLLKNSEHLARVVVSALKGIVDITALLKKGTDEKKVRAFDRYSLIVGMCGKHCDLDPHMELFAKVFPKQKISSVSKLMVDVLVPLTGASLPEPVRRPALDAVGLVCQSNPRNFVSANVYTTFQQVFDEKADSLETIVLRSFKEFLFTEERRSEQAASAGPAKDKSADKDKKDLKVMGSTSFDDVASATTQRFLKDITRIALSSSDDLALLAMEVLGTINRQGLVHPKETGVTLMTLETCPVSRISELAYQEHRALHEKHETVLEREYMKAVQSAFQYQREIVHDPRGATENPFTAKLHLLTEVLKISKSKNRMRFLEKLTAAIDFDIAKLDMRQPLPPHLEYALFIVENIGFFEFVTIGELQGTINSMEKMVTGTGSSIAQTIESEVFQMNMEMIFGTQPPPPPPPADALSQDGMLGEMPAEVSIEDKIASSVDHERLRRLSTASTIFLAAWEARSHLRRLYGLPSKREGKAKAATKDLSKPPVKVQGITGDKFWEEVTKLRTTLDSPARMVAQCRAFVELLNVDKEHRLEEDEDDMDADGDPQTPEPDEENDDDGRDPRGRKRKAEGTPGGRKKRPRSTSRPRPRGRPRKKPLDEEPSMDGDADWI